MRLGPSVFKAPETFTRTLGLISPVLKILLFLVEFSEPAVPRHILRLDSSERIKSPPTPQAVTDVNGSVRSFQRPVCTFEQAARNRYRSIDQKGQGHGT